MTAQTDVRGAVRSAIAAIDPDLPVFDVRTMDERIQAGLTGRRIPMFLAGGFAFLGLFLAVLGIHGVLAYRVGQRVREFSIRLALGSRPDQLFTLVVSEGGTLLVPRRWRCRTCHDPRRG